MSPDTGALWQPEMERTIAKPAIMTEADLNRMLKILLLIVIKVLGE